jgi:hypothetical protein
MSGDASDRTGEGPRLGNRRPTAMRRCIADAPVEGVPEWYVVRRTARIHRLSDAMVAPLPAHGGCGHSGAGRACARALDGSRALERSARRADGRGLDAPARHLAGDRASAGPTFAPNAPIEQPGRSRDTLATMVLQAKADPARSDEPAALPLEALEVSEGWTAERESRARPVAGTPSAARSQSAIGGALSRAQESAESRSNPVDLRRR